MNGKGYIEFLASKEEILNMLDSGYAKIQVYNILLSQGKLTTTRWNFYRVLKKLGIQKRKLEKLKTGAELAAEAVGKSPALPGQRKPEPGPWPLVKPADKSPEKPKEIKPRADADGSFGLEKKEEKDVF